MQSLSLLKDDWGPSGKRAPEGVQHCVLNPCFYIDPSWSAQPTHSQPSPQIPCQARGRRENPAGRGFTLLPTVGLQRCLPGCPAQGQIIQSGSGRSLLVVWWLGLGAFTAVPEFDPCRSNSGLITDPCTDPASLEKRPEKEKSGSGDPRFQLPDSRDGCLRP